MIDDLIYTLTSVLRTSLLYRSRIRNMNYKVSKYGHKITFDITRCAECHKMSAFMHSYIASSISSLKHGISHIITLNFMLPEFPFSFTERLKNINLAEGVFFADTISGNLLRNVTQEYAEQR